MRRNESRYPELSKPKKSIRKTQPKSQKRQLNSETYIKNVMTGWADEKPFGDPTGKPDAAYRISMLLVVFFEYDRFNQRC